MERRRVKRGPRRRRDGWYGEVTGAGRAARAMELREKMAELDTNEDETGDIFIDDDDGIWKWVSVGEGPTLSDAEAEKDERKQSWRGENMRWAAGGGSRRMHVSEKENRCRVTKGGAISVQQIGGKATTGEMELGAARKPKEGFNPINLGAVSVGNGRKRQSPEGKSADVMDFGGQGYGESPSRDRNWGGA